MGCTEQNGSFCFRGLKLKRKENYTKIKSKATMRGIEKQKAHKTNVVKEARGPRWGSEGVLGKSHFAWILI